MSRLAYFGRRCWHGLALSLWCGVVSACTDMPGADEISGIVRMVPPSTQNLALAFDGIDDYATTGTAEFPAGHSAQTISAWFELDTATGKHALITLRKDRDSGVEFGLDNGLVGAWRVLGNRTLLAAKTPVALGVWHHAAYTFDTATNQIYVDGALVASSNSVPDDRTPTTCWLGTLDGTRDLFQGVIDDFRVFNTARSAAQIAAEAAGIFSSADAGLVLDLPCDESSGDLVYDHSAFGNDGQLGDGVPLRMPARVASPIHDDEN